MPLTYTQHWIALDWYKLYRQMKGNSQISSATQDKHP